MFILLADTENYDCPALYIMCSLNDMNRVITNPPYSGAILNRQVELVILHTVSGKVT